ncbi:PD40 domain-containing protein [Rubellimicrobium sp. CFH 75288]|uniref:TolB family protein n=1 Tax=Rubellimicrobium sp. CFH 75288 TaxID=2697034 RepID=UPI001411F082|nr:PD40 domain-containing protein [Rubellimicrobium sp. CFH 75288]NAZ37497.1 hypothetical protein [Rubellimicrobium sp. CFH 75288]
MISELCTHDLASGRTEVVLRHEGVVEAPNWHRDGWLLVNGEGRLFRVPLDAPALHPLETGGIEGCNNDHGFSPDGRLIAFSAKGRTGASCIYTMPAAGGPPRRLTPLTPSWWHGWSPDGSRHAYAAARDGGPVLPHLCDADGHGERPLAQGFDHADGPDWSADGRRVWFNGEREGRVDLWRVSPDGTDLQRMTGGDGVDWFPHPSPDGAQVLFLRYPPGTAGHPANLPVSLMLLPQDGGPAQEVLRLDGTHRGGQGTINVPPWRPDGRAFAFVRFVP